MSQPEDTELRDLVIEALEKNGTLPTIRAQLRANIFNVFETEQEIKNENNNIINRILSDEESCLSFSIIYEFLEYCGLKNTLFVYKSESRHGKGYVYEGKQELVNKLYSEPNRTDEPVLVRLLKTLFGKSSDSKDMTNTHKRYPLDRGHFEKDERISDGNIDVAPLITFDTPEKNNESNNKKDDDNCTYIVHDDTASFGSCAYSQSDNSPDRQKLHLKLHLEHSETDTSSTDSNRDKSSSDEYIPSDNIPPGLILNESHTRGFCTQTFSSEILMQSPISLSLANGTVMKTDDRHPSNVSFDEKYAARTNSSNSYMHLNIEPKLRQESVIKKAPSIINGSNISRSNEETINESRRFNSYNDKNSTTNDNITSFDLSNLTLDNNTLKSNIDKSQSNISNLSKSQQKIVESKDLNNKLLINITPSSEKSEKKPDTDFSLSSISKSNHLSAKLNSERNTIISKIATQEYNTTNFNAELERSGGNSIESFSHRSDSKSDSDSIQEEINMTNNNSEIEESPRDLNSRSSISISDVAELLESGCVDSPIDEKSSSQKKTNSNRSPRPHIDILTNLFNGKNLTIVDSPFKDLPSNKNITLRPCSNLNDNEKAKFSTVTSDVDTYSDSFSQTISNDPSENIEWKSESI